MSLDLRVSSETDSFHRNNLNHLKITLEDEQSIFDRDSELELIEEYKFILQYLSIPNPLSPEQFISNFKNEYLGQVRKLIQESGIPYPELAGRSQLSPDIKSLIERETHYELVRHGGHWNHITNKFDNVSDEQYRNARSSKKVELLLAFIADSHHQFLAPIHTRRDYT